MIRNGRLYLLGMAAGLAMFGAGASARSPGQPGHSWSASWLAAPAPPGRIGGETFDNVTLVETLRISAGGSRLRLRLSNEYGDAPLTIGTVNIARIGADGQVMAGTERAVTFSGEAGAVVPAGAPVVSDAMDLAVPDLARLKVSIYLPKATGSCTGHATAGEITLVSPPGDHGLAPFVAARTIDSRPFLTELDVETASPRRVVVAFGDSITDGYRSTAGAYRRWPDVLAGRLVARSPSRPVAVANAGISGNRLLADGFFPPMGQGALARLDRDLIALPGASDVILLEGINDIMGGGETPPSAREIIAGYRQVIARAHGRGIRVTLGTIMPNGGSAHFLPQGEAVRIAVNRWVRATREADGLIDFDHAMADPAHPDRLRADWQSGDWLHPNDAGYAAMARAAERALIR